MGDAGDGFSCATWPCRAGTTRRRAKSNRVLTILTLMAFGLPRLPLGLWFSFRLLLRALYDHQGHLPHEQAWTKLAFGNRPAVNLDDRWLGGTPRFGTCHQNNAIVLFLGRDNVSV